LPPHLLSGLATHLYRLLSDRQLCGLRLHCWRLRDRTRFLDLLFGPRLASHLPLGPPLGLARPSGCLGQLSPLHLTTPSICGPSTFKNPHDQTIERARRSRGHETAPRVCRVTQGGPFRGHWSRRANTAIRHNSRERRQRKQAHTRREGACRGGRSRRPRGTRTGNGGVCSRRLSGSQKTRWAPQLPVPYLRAASRTVTVNVPP
jgi:hypothetical protein